MTANKLWSAWLKTGLAKDENPPENFSDHLLKFKVPAKAKKDWEQFCYVLDEMVVGDGYAQSTEMITSVLEGVYDDYMKSSFENYDHRRQDIEQLILYAEGYDDIIELLGQLSLMSTADGNPAGKDLKRLPHDSVALPKTASQNHASFELLHWLS